MTEKINKRASNEVRCPPKMIRTAKNTGRSACATRLLGGLGLHLVEGEAEARLVAVGGVLVENALGDGLIDRRKRGIQKIGCRGDVAGGNGGANARAVGTIDFGPLARLRRAL